MTLFLPLLRATGTAIAGKKPALLSIILFSIFSSTLQAQYYRTKNSGNWSDLSTWESSVLGLVWIDALAVPGSSAATIQIRNAHTVTVSNAESMNRVEIAGTLSIQSGSITVNNQFLGPSGEIIIQGGGQLVTQGSSSFAAEIKGNSPKIIVADGGKIKVGNGGSIASDTYSGFATGPNTTWQHNSQFEWNSTVPLPIAGAVFFPGVGAGVKPKLLLSNTGSLIGGAGNTTINGLLQVESSFSLSGAGSKTIRDGIAGSGSLTIAAGSGAVSISGSTAILGGRNLSIQMDRSVSIGNGLTIPADSSVSIRTAGAAAFTGKGSNAFTVNGSLDIGTVTIDNTAGAVHINGYFKTGHAAGLEGGSITASSIVNVNTGSTIEYNAPGDQLVTASGLLEGAGYYNIAFSGSGVKALSGPTPATALVKISGTAVVDAVQYNLGSASAGFTMENGRLHMGLGGLQPQMAGSYNITGGTLQFSRNGSAQQVRSGSNCIYHHIEIAGDQLSSYNGQDIYLRPGGIFTLKSTGSFFSESSCLQGSSGTQAYVMETGSKLFCANEAGFNGPAIAGQNAAVGSNIENISLAPGSWVHYNRSSGSGLQYITNSVAYQHLVIAGTGYKMAPAGNLTVQGNLSKTGASVFVHNEGRLLFTGTGGQVFSNSSAFPFLLYNMSNNSSGAGLSINGDSLSIARELLLGSGSKLRLGIGNIILKSTESLTAQLAPVPEETGIIEYAGSGRFIVERYLPALKAWRFVATPVKMGAGISPTVSEAWREAGSTASSGYGTQVSGPAGYIGMDEITNAPSMKWYNMATNNYVPVSNTNSPLSNQAGYMVFVRGDRAVGISGTGGATNLRIKGQLRTGNQSFDLAANASQSIGNPFACSISYQQLLAATPGLANYYIAWDPSIYGTYGTGGYQTLSALDGFKANAPGSALYIKDSHYPDIASGQAFFVVNTGAAPIELIIKEQMKTGSSRMASRENSMQDRNFLRTRLYTANRVIADGNLVAFDDELENELNGEDAIKFMNAGENFGLQRYGKKLSVEARQRPKAGDTLYFNMSNLRQQNYILEIEPENFPLSPVEAWLTDRFLSTQSRLSLQQSNEFVFTVTANAASKAADRFLLVFKQAAVLPVHITGISATALNSNTVLVKWTVEEEINLLAYQLEHSPDGLHFSTLGQLPATGNASYGLEHLNAPAGQNYYRIKAVSKDGNLPYSDITRLILQATNTGYDIYPNPVTGHIASLHITDQPAGAYMAELTSAEGKLLYRQKLRLMAGSSVQELRFSPALPAGLYQLRLLYHNKTVHAQSILLK